MINTKTIAIFFIVVAVLICSIIIVANATTILGWLMSLLSAYGMPYLFGVATVVVAQMISQHYSDKSDR